MLKLSYPKFPKELFACCWLMYDCYYLAGNHRIRSNCESFLPYMISWVMDASFEWPFFYERFCE